MKPPVISALALAAALAGASASWSQPPARVGGDYVFTGDIDVGAPGFWDYVTFDRDAGRLYVAHIDKISVVDLATRKVIGTVGPMSGAHGTAIVGALHKGYATSGEDGLLKVFDLNDFHVITELKVGKDADGVLFDPRANLVIVTIGDGKQLVMVDPVTDRVVRTVDLPAGPETVVFDAHGKLYVNLASTAQIAKIDIASGHIDAIWPLAGCKDPSGLAYDSRTNRLFSGCGNAVLVVVDPTSGRTIASLPTGRYSDGVGVDESRHRVFSPNGDGTLTIIGEEPGDRYVVERLMPTFLGGRSMAVDPQTGILFLTHGDTQIKSGLPDPLKLRFGWDGVKVATFVPND